jgi:hypothetical protein
MADLSGYPRAIAFDSSNTVFVACQSPSIYQASVVKYSGGWVNVYNYQNTSGVLDLEMDANDNIFCYANAGSLTIGVAPYTSGLWEAFSASTSVDYGGPISGVSEIESVVAFEIDDTICLKFDSGQHGKVVRIKPGGVSKGVVICWTNDSTYPTGELRAFFGQRLTDIEHL